MDNKPISIFNSGLGSLTSVSHLIEVLPKERLIYFGDTARTPYGSKAESTVKNFAGEIAGFLVEQGVKMIIIACNTVSAIFSGELSERFPDIPVVGIIEPATEKVVTGCSDSSSVGIIGTKVTINSAGFIDYAYGLHYHFRPTPELKILAGGSAGAMFGFVYNMQNGNNPAALHVDLDMRLSAAVIYTFRLHHCPLTVRYQTDIPVVGMLFSPHYGQSYYEIFGVGNSDGVIQCFSLHNKWALRNYLTVDLPVGNWTVRLGYLNDFYQTKVNGIQTDYVIEIGRASCRERV